MHITIYTKLLKTLLLKIFNIEKDESLSVSLLMIQSLFIGIFNGTFYISSHTLFIGSYGGESIPLAYLISGGVGIILTLIYSKFQEKVKFASLSKANLVFVALVTIGLSVSYLFIDKKLVDYAQFVLFGPLFVLSIVSFWGVANRLYNLRQGKRLFGIIDAGIIFGIIISNVAVAAIPYISGFEIAFEDILYASSACTLLTVIIQFAISSKFDLDKKIEKVDVSSTQKEDSGFKILFRNKYVLMMAAFAGLSMLIAFFIQYSFILVMEKKYPSEIEFGSFLGAFTGVIMIFTLLIKTFVYSKLIKNYGLKVCLVILPILLSAFTIGAIGIGYGMGIEDIESSGFLFFFMLIALSKLIAQALKEGIELPSFKLIYQTLNKKIRFIVQAQIDGTVNEFSALMSGLCLVGLSALTFVGLTEISVVMLIVVLIWLYVAFKLYKSYIKSLESGLKVETLSDQENRITPVSNSILKKIKTSINKVDENLIISFQAIDPVLFEKELENIANKIVSEKLENFLFDEVFIYPNINHASALKQIEKNSKSEENKTRSKSLLSKIESTYDKVNYQKIISLSNSKETEDRVIAAILIRSNYDSKYDTILLRLIKDPNQNVKNEVIKTCGVLGKVEFAPIIIEYLADDELYASSYSTLKELGENNIEFLSQAYFKSNVADKSLIVVTELISFINNERADALLLEKLFSTNRLIMNKAAAGINAKQLKPKSEKETLELINLLNEQLSIVAWNYAAYDAFSNNHPEMVITLEAIEDDIELSKNVLFSLLAIIYDSNSVKIVQDNIQSGDPDNISYAMEMLDLFIHEHIKPKVFPILDDSNLNDRITLLEDYFPIEVFKERNIFDLVLNRDSNYFSDWTKASVVYEMDLEQQEISQTFIAQLFNPKQIIRETSYYKISMVKAQLRNSIINRFNENEQYNLNKEISDITRGTNGLLVESLLKLKEVIDTKSFKPMDWVNDISHVKSEIVKNGAEIKLNKNSLNFLLRGDDFNSQSLNIVNDHYKGVKLNDRIISINKNVFNKVASNHVLTKHLLLE